MKLESFEQLFHVLLSEIYNIELIVSQETPFLLKQVQSPELKAVLQEHSKETKTHVARLEKVFKLLGIAPLNIPWITNLESVIGKWENVFFDSGKSPVIDAAIIVIEQRIQHVEIASYGAIIEYADAMNLDVVKDILKDSIKEEGRANANLTKVAKGGFFKAGVNAKALAR